MPGLRCPGSQGDGEVGLAGAGWSEQDDVGLGGHEVGHPEVGDEFAVQAGCAGEVEVLEGLRAGNPARRIRVSAPWASRAATSRPRTAARYSSWLQPCSRAVSARRS